MEKRHKEPKAESKIPLGVSSCLLGENVRYDGGHRLDHYLRDTLGQFVKWAPACPEVECGLSVPREAMRLIGDPGFPRLVTRFTGSIFIERVFVYHRWQQLIHQGGRIRDLAAFHTRHKHLLMSHSSRLLKELGALVSNPKQYGYAELLARYFMTLMQGLRLTATRTKHANVLQHLAGYFKKQLSPPEKQELLGVIGQYRAGLVPLIVPLTLIRHYVRKYEEPYLKGQFYLETHPLELMLRNHV